MSDLPAKLRAPQGPLPVPATSPRKSRRDETAAAARAATEEAQDNKDNVRNPADFVTHDKANSGGSQGDSDEWWNDAAWYADAFNWGSIVSGFVAAAAAFAAPWTGPAAPFVGALAGLSGWVSMGSAGLSTLFTGIEYGVDSGEFLGSLTGTGLGVLTLGQSKWIGHVLGGVASPIAKRASQLGSDLISPITGALGSLFG